MLENFQVNSLDYSKPLRLYADVDGVLSPFFRTSEEQRSHTPQQLISVQRFNAVGPSDYNFEWIEFVAQKFSEWSKHPAVDFVWLTSHNANAPSVIDPLLDIESLGYLPWAQKMSDHTQVFKGRAIEDDQQEKPSDFIWIDDMANIRRNGEPLFIDWDNSDEDYDDEGNVIGIVESIPSSRYLAVTPDGYVGLSLADISRIDSFIQDRS